MVTTVPIPANTNQPGSDQMSRESTRLSSRLARAEAAVAELSRHFAVANDRALDTLRLRLLPPPSHEREATAAE